MMEPNPPPSRMPLHSSKIFSSVPFAPPEKMTQYFGLFAFSGKVTAFLAPLMVTLT